MTTGFAVLNLQDVPCRPGFMDKMVGVKANNAHYDDRKVTVCVHVHTFGSERVYSESVYTEEMKVRLASH